MRVLPLAPALGAAPFFAWCTRLWRLLPIDSSVRVGCGGVFFVHDTKAIDPDTDRERAR